MEIKSKQNQYLLELAATDTIEIKINGNIVFNETVNTDKKARVQFSFEETDDQPIV